MYVCICGHEILNLPVLLFSKGYIIQRNKQNVIKVASPSYKWQKIMGGVPILLNQINQYSKLEYFWVNFGYYSIQIYAVTPN